MRNAHDDFLNARFFAWVARVLGQAWSVPLMAVLLAGTVVWHDAPNWLISLVMTALVVATCIRPEQPLAPVLGHAWVRYVGTVSYGVYLLHMLALNVVRRAVPGQGVAVYVVLTLAMSVLVATLSHRYFESQFLKLKGRFDWRERPQHVPEPRRPRAPQPVSREPGSLVGMGAKA